MHLGYAPMNETSFRIAFSKCHNSTNNVLDAKVLSIWGRASEKGNKSKCIFRKILKLQPCTLGARSNMFFQSLVGFAENEQHEILSSPCS